MIYTLRNQVNGGDLYGTHKVTFLDVDAVCDRAERYDLIRARAEAMKRGKELFGSILMRAEDEAHARTHLKSDEQSR